MHVCVYCTRECVCMCVFVHAYIDINKYGELVCADVLVRLSVWRAYVHGIIRKHTKRRTYVCTYVCLHVYALLWCVRIWMQLAPFPVL